MLAAVDRTRQFSPWHIQHLASPPVDIKDSTTTIHIHRDRDNSIEIHSSAQTARRQSVQLTRHTTATLGAVGNYF